MTSNPTPTCPMSRNSSGKDQKGTIRVRPKPGGGICIVPFDMSENDEPIEVQALPAPSHDEVSPQVSGSQGSPRTCFFRLTK